MKKIIKSVLLCVMLLPISVKADMGAPIVAPYKVVPKSVEGAPYYEEDCDFNGCVKSEAGIIPYDTEVKVEFEYYEEEEEITYGQITIGDDLYIIDIRDFMEITKEYKPNFDEHYDYKVSKEGYIIASEGLEMKKGPSIAYEKTGVTIPKGEIVKITIEHGDEDTVWAYTTYKGQKGWIYCLDGGIGFELEDFSIEYYKDIPVYENVDRKKQIGTIKAYEIIEYPYQIDAWSRMYYVEHKGVKGYIDYQFNITKLDKEQYKDTYFKKGSTIRKDPKEGSKILKKIEKETLIEIIGTTNVESGEDDYLGTNWYYVEYDGTKGWMIESSMTEETLERLFGTDEEEYFDNEEDGYLDNEEDEDFEEDYDDEKSNPEEFEEKEENKNKPSSHNKQKIGPKEIVILCIGGAIISALTAAVTIVLFNKKSKKNLKKDEKQAEIINTIAVDNENIVVPTQAIQEQVIEQPTQIEEKSEINNEIEKDSQ